MQYHASPMDYEFTSTHQHKDCTRWKMWPTLIHVQVPECLFYCLCHWYVFDLLTNNLPLSKGLTHNTARCWFSCQMATNKSSPHLQIRHYLSGLLLTDWKWLHPIVITFNTPCLVELCIQRCGTLRWTHWPSYLKQFICSCLVSYFSGKATTVGSPPNFPKLISQLWGIRQPQYFITLLLDVHLIYFWKHYIYYKKDT